jgi:hypothetical protein
LDEDGHVQTELVDLLGETISQIVNESKAAGKLKLGYTPDVGMIFVVEFNPEKVLEHISVWACIEGRTKTLERDNRRARKTGLVTNRWVKAV